jgi:hypothetical protein
MHTRASKLPSSVLIEPVKLNPTDLNRLLDELDAAGVSPSTNRRGSERVACRRTVLLVTIDQNGFQSTFMIAVRDISEGGVAFLHRSMLHQGTRCTIRVRTPDQKWLVLGGSVVRSRYIRDMVYEVGLQLDATIDVGQLGLRPKPQSTPAATQP